MNRLYKILSVILIAFVLLLAVALLYFKSTFYSVANPSEEKFPVRGVDVSSYQGDIDWGELASQGIDFAFIKATEGSGTKDAYFTANWQEAKNAGLLVGGYHFFSYDSPGKTQAENFISTVPKENSTLPPVIDIEFYDDYYSSPMKRSEVHAILDELIEELTDHYGRTPILYTTQLSYIRYIFGSYRDCPLWMRNLSRQPIPVDRDWTFWQYSMTGELTGHSGLENNLDMNVFNGSLEELRIFCNQPAQ